MRFAVVTILGDQAVIGFIVFIALLAAAFMAIVNWRERRGPRRSRLPEGPLPEVAPTPAPAWPASRPRFGFIWPRERMSVISAAQVQLGQLRKEWGEADREVWAMCLLGECLEAKGEHFDMMFTSADASVRFNSAGLIAMMGQMDVNGLDGLMHQMETIQYWNDGVFPKGESEAALAGVLIDPATRLSSEMLLASIFETDPYSHFLPSLHGLLVERYHWNGAPEGKPFVPGWREKVTFDWTWVRPHRPPLGHATDLLATAFHFGVGMKARKGTVPPEAAALYLDAARVWQAFGDEDLHRSFHDDALQTHLVTWLRAHGFERVGDEIAARALRDALSAARSGGRTPRWSGSEPIIDRDFDFAARAEAILDVADAWFDEVFPWEPESAPKPPRKPRPMRAPKVHRLPGGRGAIPRGKPARPDT